MANATNSIQFVGENPNGGDNTALIDEVTLATASDQITDGGFETPALAADNYQPTPSGTAWTFSGASGVAGNGSAITSGNANAPEGAQVAYIQGTGSISQSVYLDVGTYNLSFLAAQCVNHQSQNQQIQVTVNGTTYGSITPNTTGYTLYQTLNFPVTTAGLYTIQLNGTTPSTTSTALIDQVSIAAVQDSLADGSFATPALPVDYFQPTPDGSAWAFTNTAGIATNKSAYTLGNANAPVGTQTAYIQNNGTMSQAVYLDAGTYSISFLATQRVFTGQTENQVIQVQIDPGQADAQIFAFDHTRHREHHGQQCRHLQLHSVHAEFFDFHARHASHQIRRFE